MAARITCTRRRGAEIEGDVSSCADAGRCASRRGWMPTSGSSACGSSRTAACRCGSGSRIMTIRSGGSPSCTCTRCGGSTSPSRRCSALGRGARGAPPDPPRRCAPRIPTIRAAAAAFGRAQRRAHRTGRRRARARSGTRTGRASQSDLNARLSRLRRGAAPIERHPGRGGVRPHGVLATVRPARTGPAPTGRSRSVTSARSWMRWRAGVPHGDLCCVGVGPRRNFRARRWWDPVAGAEPVRPAHHPDRTARAETGADRQLGAVARPVRRSRAISRRATASARPRVFRGCDLWPILRAELEEVATTAVAVVRARDGRGGRRTRRARTPCAVVTYAEAGGWGRALMLEARRRRIPSVGLQHGFIYRHWLNYLPRSSTRCSAIGADRGCPIPDRTLVFDRYADAHLPIRRPLPRRPRWSSRAMPGSTSWRPNATALRASCAIASAANSAWTGDQAAGRAGGEILGNPRRAARPGRRRPSAIPAHAADRQDAPGGDRSMTTPTPSGGAANDSVAPAPRPTSARLLVAADAIVTMNSTVAIDGLVLGVPALVIGLPNNLSPFVDGRGDGGRHRSARIASGCSRSCMIRTRAGAIVAAGAAFASRFALRSDGQAARRMATEIRADRAPAAAASLTRGPRTQTPAHQPAGRTKEHEAHESTAYRRRRIRRIASGRRPARAGPRGDRRSTISPPGSMDNIAHLKGTSRLRVRDRHDHERIADGRARRPRRCRLPPRRRRRRQADRRSPGPHDRDQRARHGDRPQARRQEGQVDDDLLDVGGVREEHRPCPSAKTRTW